MFETRLHKQLTTAILFIAMALTLFSTSANATSITASVDRNPVVIDESFNLRLRANGSVDSDPDLSPLKQDFEILTTSKSSSMNYINGNFSRENVWNISLISKTAGVHTIPSINFGKDQSPAIRITVNDVDQIHKKKTDTSLFLEVETDVDSTWVQGQVIYTTRLFRNTVINNASLSPPQTSDSDAIIEKLGDDKSYEAYRDGVRYDVIERRYAVFPQKSGTLTIQPTRFEGRIGHRRSLFDSMYNNDKIKRVRSRALELKVEPVPAGFAADRWLPAKKLSIVEDWSVPMDKLKAGEPVTRTLTILGSGVLANQIPDPVFTDVDGIKQYPDQPQSDNRVSRDGVDAVKKIKLAMIPSRAGSYTLPAIELPWWNTTTGKQEIASIPAQNISVADGAVTQDTPPATQPLQQPANTAPVLSQDATATPATTDAGIWPWISLLLAAAWLLTLYILISKRGTTAAATPSLASLRKQLLHDCDISDAHASKHALLAWAGARWPALRLHNLMDIAPLLDAEAADAVRELNSTLYSDHADRWSGIALAQAIRALPVHVTTASEQPDPVEPLYRV